MYSINDSVDRLNDCLLPFSTFISGHRSRPQLKTTKINVQNFIDAMPNVNTNAIYHVPWNYAVILKSEKVRCQNSKQTEGKIKTFISHFFFTCIHPDLLVSQRTGRWMWFAFQCCCELWILCWKCNGEAHPLLPNGIMSRSFAMNGVYKNSTHKMQKITTGIKHSENWTANQSTCAWTTENNMNNSEEKRHHDCIEQQ